jgi:hypothetical protein
MVCKHATYARKLIYAISGQCADSVQRVSKMNLGNPQSDSVDGAKAFYVLQTTLCNL